MVDQEFEEFKSRIDLREYAASLGYELDRRESSRSSSIMRDATGDKVVIKRDSDAHFVYFSVRDDRDNGSIVDFVAHRKRLSFGHIRKHLRPWIGRPAAPLPLFAPLLPSPKDRAAVERAYSRMPIAARHPYLEQDRHIPGTLLASSRFVGRVRVDERGNAVFPHFDLSGLCGFEKKNRDFTGFATGGIKGLWESHDQTGDNCLVLAESAIDALSYAALFPNAKARYRSIGGQVNDQQPGLIRAGIMDLPEAAEIVAAMDNDDAGRKLAALVETAVTAAGRPAAAFRLHLPATPGTDWNEALKGSSPTVPCSPPMTSPDPV